MKIKTNVSDLVLLAVTGTNAEMSEFHKFLTDNQLIPHSGIFSAPKLTNRPAMFSAYWIAEDAEKVVDFVEKHHT